MRRLRFTSTGVDHEVHSKAEDTKLDGPVAPKFLPNHLLGDEEVRWRFEREAKAAALRRALNVGSQPQRRAS